MEKDRIERYIENRKEDFEAIELPDIDKMWRQFEQPMEGKVVLFSSRLKAAMMLVLASVIGAMTFYLVSSSTQEPFAEVFANDPELGQNFTQLVSTINHHKNTIENAELDEAIYKELYEELRYLESLESSYAQDVDKFGGKKELVKSLLKHYERKAYILELLLFEIEKKSQNEKIYTPQNL